MKICDYGKIDHNNMYIQWVLLCASTARNVLENCDISLKVFSNLEIVMMSAVTNCAARERSFSVLKRVKNYKRSTMTNYRLNE